MISQVERKPRGSLDFQTMSFSSFSLFATRWYCQDFNKHCESICPTHEFIYNPMYLLVILDISVLSPKLDNVYHRQKPCLFLTLPIRITVMSMPEQSQNALQNDWLECHKTEKFIVTMRMNHLPHGTFS